MESEILRALADPTRRAVFERLAAGEMTVGALKQGFDISQPAISQHLAQLRKAGLVAERREGRNTYYAAKTEGLDPLLSWIDRYRTFWPEKVERLKTVLKGMDQ
jgi:DNA-binding transcriptional ArsR family regulator